MRRSLIIIVALTLGVPDRGAAQSVVATPPAGYFTIKAAGGGDTMSSLPLVRRSAYIGRISAVSADSLTLADANWLPDEFDAASGGAHYLQFVTGPLAGVAYKISANAADSVTLATLGDDLTNHVLGQITAGTAGDIVRIRRLWTVSSVFGEAGDSVLIDKSSDLSEKIYRDADLLLFPDNTQTGTHKKPVFAAGFLTDVGWRLHGQPSSNAAGIEFWPGLPFVLRRHSPAEAEAIIIGYVATESVAVRIPAVAIGVESDVAIAYAYPASPSLDASGLDQVVEASDSFDAVGDVVLTFLYGAIDFAPNFRDRIYRLPQGWRLGEQPFGSFNLQPGTGYLLRLRGERAARYWIQNPPN